MGSEYPTYLSKLFSFYGGSFFLLADFVLFLNLFVFLVRHFKFPTVDLVLPHFKEVLVLYNEGIEISQNE